MKKSLNDFVRAECGLQNVTRINSVFGHIKMPFKMAYFSIKPNEKTIEHTHEEDEIFMCIEGEGCYTINAQSYIFKKNDIWFSKSGEYHQLINPGIKDIQMIAIWW